MKILIPINRIPDPARRLPLMPGGQWDERAIRWVIDPSAKIALEEAVRLRERGADMEIVAVGIGGAGMEESLREALARGADRALLLWDEGATDEGIVTHFLAAVFRREKADLALMGGQSGPRLAGMLPVPQATNACYAALGVESVRVRCEMEAGQEQSAVTLPAVLTVAPSLNEPRLLSLFDIVAARTKPLTQVQGTEFGPRPAIQVSVLRWEMPPPRRANRKVGSVDELAAILREEGGVR